MILEAVTFVLATMVAVSLSLIAACLVSIVFTWILERVG